MKHPVDRCPACIEVSGDLIAAALRLETIGKPSPTPPPPKVSKPVKARKTNWKARK